MINIGLFFGSIEDSVSSFVVENVLFISIAFASFIGKLKESSKRNIFSAWFFYLFGTFFHEMAHLVVSLISFGKPTKISLLPSKIEREDGKTSYVLGYIESSNMTWYNTFLISMAPFSLFYIAFFVYKNFFLYFDMGFLSVLSYVFIIVSLIFSAIPSTKDFSNIFKSGFLGNLVVPIAITVGFLFYYGLISLQGVKNAGY